jgi:hypothetical protein
MSETRLITRDNLVGSLRIVVPGFEINPDWLDGDFGDPLGYPIIDDLARYICDQARLADFDQVRNGLAFLEGGLESGDTYILDLVHESLETLLACDNITAIKAYFGPRVLDLWNASFQTQ